MRKLTGGACGTVCSTELWRDWRKLAAGGARKGGGVAVAGGVSLRPRTCRSEMAAGATSEAGGS